MSTESLSPQKPKTEFEREAVPTSALKRWTHFLGMYAGEHAAGTEFVIGPLFLTTGVSAFDLIFDLIYDLIFDLKSSTVTCLGTESIGVQRCRS